MSIKPTVTLERHQAFQQKFLKSRDNEQIDPIDTEVMQFTKNHGNLISPKKESIKFLNQRSSQERVQLNKTYTKRYESQFLQKVLLQLTRGSKWYRKIKLNENIIRFIQSIRNESRLFSINELNEYHHNIIQDKTNFIKTSVSEEQYLKSFGKHRIQKKNPFDLIRNKLFLYVKSFREYYHYMPNFPVLSPISRVYYFWQIIQFIVILHTLIQFPLIQTFGSQVIDNNCKIYSWIFLIEFMLLILDILFNCNVSVLEKGEMLTDRWSIISKYGNRQLFIDMMGLTGFILQKQAYLNFNCQVEFGFLQWFQYLFLFKAVKLKKIVKKFEKLMNFAPAVKSYINLLKLFVFVFLVAHFLCCLWYQFAMYSLNYYEINFLESVLGQDWYMHYMYSLYYILMTMTTICYGDVIPKNDLERFALLFVMLLCSALFGYTLNSINQILDELKSNQENYQKQKQIILNYMESRSISKELQMRVKNYFKCAFKNGLYNNMEQEQNTLAKLSLSLNEELIFEDKGRLLMNIPFFAQNFSYAFIRRLSHYVKELFYSPGDELQNEENSSFSNNSFIYIYKGKIQMFAQNMNQKLQTLDEGQYFGVDNLLSEEYQRIQLKADDVSIVYVLRFQDFNDIITQGEFSEDYEKFSMLKDMFYYTNNRDGLNMKCLSCQKQDHYVIQCPLVTFVPNKEKVIKKLQFTLDNGRSKFERLRKMKERYHKEEMINEQLVSQYFKEINNQQSFSANDGDDVSEKSFQDIPKNRRHGIQYEIIEEKLSQNSLEEERPSFKVLARKRTEKVVGVGVAESSKLLEMMGGKNKREVSLEIEMEFERCNVFKNYFPNENYDRVVQRLKNRKRRKTNRKTKKIK